MISMETTGHVAIFFLNRSTDLTCKVGQLKKDSHVTSGFHGNHWSFLNGPTDLSCKVGRFKKKDSHVTSGF